MKNFFNSLKRTYTGSQPTPAEQLVALLQAIDEPLLAGKQELAEARCHELGAFLDGLASSSSDEETQRLLGAGYFDLGGSYRAMQKVPEAEAAYARSLQVLGALTSSAAHAQFAQSQIAACHNHLGLLYLDCGPSVKAELAFDKAITLRRKIYANRPDDGENQVYLGGSLCNLGHLAREHGDTAGALALYEEAIATIEAAIPHCDCGCRDAIASAVSAATGHPHWIMLGHQFRHNAEEGRQIITGEASTTDDS